MLVAGSEIHKVYGKDGAPVPVLKGVSFAIGQGEFVAIVGPSGSGKSTLMNLVGLLDRPTSGDLVVAGVSVAGLTENGLAELRASAIGFVFQSYQLLPRCSALENVAMPLHYAAVPRHARCRRAAAALERVGLAAKTGRRPNELSGGEQQRVAIARALVREPRILLADEPTGALDSATGLDILKLFEELHAGGHTVILVTHDPKIAARAGRTIQLCDGAIVPSRTGPMQ